MDFNPRSPYGERPGFTVKTNGETEISIHAPLTGSDVLLRGIATLLRDFNPRSPYGERLNIKVRANCDREFQSTLPLRGATSHHSPWCLLLSISIHAPLTGSDKCNFSGPDNSIISIHAPLTGSDMVIAYKVTNPVNFNPRSPYGERRLCTTWAQDAFYFNPRSPYGERLELHRTLYLPFSFQSTLPLRGAT